MTENDIDQLECPSCESSDSTVRLNHPESETGVLREGWYCDACEIGYAVKYEAVEKRKMESAE